MPHLEDTVPVTNEPGAKEEEEPGDLGFCSRCKDLHAKEGTEVGTSNVMSLGRIIRWSPSL